MRDEQRRLAAIVAADVAGYSRLMGQDESGTLAALKTLRQDIVDPTVARHRGRIVKTTGDGLLLEFPSVVDAVRCALTIQDEVTRHGADVPEDRRIAFRIGINLGDVIVEGDDIFGDGVNVAARLEAIADPGGICLSDDAFRQVRGKIDAAFEDMGPLTLKNIVQPVDAWRWRARSVSSQSRILALPDKPSIAVLPFQNMSGDPEQEYFADGMTEDILTALSRFQNLFVIARNSSFTYKGRSVDIKQVGKELGVGYVLEGSVRAAPNRVRITAQLIDAVSGHHVWAERYDRSLTDIFALQDEVTAQIVAAIDFEVRGVEAQRPIGLASAGWEAWAGYHKAFPLLFRLTEEQNRKAVKLFDELRTAHPTLAVAHAGYGFARGSEVIYEWATDRTATARAAVGPCRKAVELDDKDAFCHLALGRALLLAGDRELALPTIERAVARNPNSAASHLFRAVTLICLDRESEALPDIDLAIRLNPRDPGLWSFYFWQGRCHRARGDLDAAIRSLRQAIDERADLWFTHLDLGTTLAMAGRAQEAQRAVAKARELKPDLTLEAVAYLDSLFASPRQMEENQRRAAALGVATSHGKSRADAPSSSLALPDRPSIAVLPFQNMSGDPEQEYFADGIVEDVITALSRFKSLFVIARNSSFTYKGRAIDIKQVGRELGVRYVLEGSVRKAGNRLRITGQLIDSETGAHVWADRFDGALEDVFTLQDEVTEKVVAAIAPGVEQAEIERARRKPTANLNAHDCYLRASASWWRASREGSDEAVGLLKHALEIDPDHSAALALLLAAYANRKMQGMAQQGEHADVERLIRHAIRIGQEDAAALGYAGYAIAVFLRDLAFAKEQIGRALMLNPNLASTWACSAYIHLWSGNPGKTVEDLSHAARFDPLNQSGHWRSGLAHAHYFLGQYQEALRLAESMLQRTPDAPSVLRIGAAAAAFAGQMEVARRLASRLRQVDPTLRLSRLQDYLGPYPAGPLEKYKQGLRLAGIPE